MNRPDGRTGRWDRLDAARRCLVAGLVCLAVTLAAVGADRWIGGDRPGPAAGALFRELGLGQMALVPSGRPLRTRLTVPPGMDVRFHPGLFAEGGEPARLILQAAPGSNTR